MTATADRDVRERVAADPIAWRRLGWLCALVAVLAVVAAVDIPARLAPASDAPRVPLVEFSAASVAALDVVGKGLSGRFSRVPGGWTVAVGGAPAEPVDGGIVDGFLGELAKAGRLTQFVENDPGAFGLAPPRGSVALRGATAAEIRFGDRNPPLTALYVQVFPAPDVVLVGSVLLWEYDKLLGEVRRVGSAGGSR